MHGEQTQGQTNRIQHDIFDFQSGLIAYTKMVWMVQLKVVFTLPISLSNQIKPT